MHLFPRSDNSLYASNKTIRENRPAVTQNSSVLLPPSDSFIVFLLHHSKKTYLFLVPLDHRRSCTRCRCYRSPHWTTFQEYIIKVLSKRSATNEKRMHGPKGLFPRGFSISNVAEKKKRTILPFYIPERKKTHYGSRNCGNSNHFVLYFVSKIAAVLTNITDLITFLVKASDCILTKALKHQ